MKQPLDKYFMSIARDITNTEGCECTRAGAVIVNEQGWMLATGVNRMLRRQTGKYEPACTGNPSCRSGYPEITALSKLSKNDLAHTIFCTLEPCREATLVLSMTDIVRVVYMHEAKDSGKDLWEYNWEQFKL